MSPNSPARDAFLEGRIQSVIDHLNDMPLDVRTPAALATAAEVLEYAAYELAQTDRPRHVARLILLAADLERTAAELRRRVRGDEDA
ncbi:hypothetical protein [uncultured Tateyamaria sp.]|uniref:hypothetical protein n=1 Tax=uncultured Tateyamaria sp. TaxID=455651 RepID=UPI00260E79C9|nr:hypothetical protein [uncultured Tateyamaria sp.]